MKKMKYMKNTACVVAAIFSTAMFTSCTGNFEDLNTHPTDLYPGGMTPTEEVGSLFPAMINMLNPNHENKHQYIEQMVGGQYGGYFTTTNNWQGTNFGTYNPAVNWVDEPFKSMFIEFYPNYITVKNATQSSGYIYAWANIIRVGVMLRVADTYGPIPYSKMGGGEFAVAYDNVQDLYHNMITDLTNSVNTLSAFLQESAGASLPIAEYDIIYNGDFSKWIRYANSLKLRMAVRIAGVDTEYAKQIMKEAIDGGVIEQNSDNAYIPSSDNPLYKSAYDWGDVRINASISTYMNGYKDPRIGKYMTSTSYGTYNGVRMGIANIDKGVYGTDRFSKPLLDQHSPLPVYYAAETYFLKAEAALKGWIEGGDVQAKSYYEQGIRTSMEQYGVALGDYLVSTDVPSKYEDPTGGAGSVTIQNAPTVSWDGAGDKLAKIITQKWIAIFPMGYEAWCDFRRTGYPQLITANNNLSSDSYMGSIDDSRMVRRLPYPSTEISSNSVNVQEAIATMLGGVDKGSTDLWWAKKN